MTERSDIVQAVAILGLGVLAYLAIENIGRGLAGIGKGFGDIGKGFGDVGAGIGNALGQAGAATQGAWNFATPDLEPLATRSGLPNARNPSLLESLLTRPYDTGASILAANPLDVGRRASSDFWYGLYDVNPGAAMTAYQWNVATPLPTTIPEGTTATGFNPYDPSGLGIAPGFGSGRIA